MKEDLITLLRSGVASTSLEVRIAEHPFLQGMAVEHLRALSDCAMQSGFESGELIFREGDPANRFYLLQKGKVVLEARSQDGEPVAIETLGPGDVLGWSWLFAPHVWHFDARAVAPTSAIFFYGTRLREECERDHDLGYELIKRMAGVVIERLQATRRRLAGSSLNGGKS